MGLRVDIYRDRHDPHPLTAFNGRDTVVVVNVDGPFEPTDEAPAARLATNALGDPIIVPVPRERPGSVGPMFGGTFAYTSDSRFGRAAGQYGALAVHDLYEVWR